MTPGEYHRTAPGARRRLGLTEDTHSDARSQQVHRTRALEKKDGNPLNEVRVIGNSLVQNQGVLAADNTIKLDPSKSVLGLHVEDEIRMNAADFQCLIDAFFDEIEAKFT